MNKKAKDIAEGIVVMIGKGKGKEEHGKEEECTCKNCPMHGNPDEKDED